MKLLSLFSGIGAFEKALTNIGIDYELVGFSEIDKWAIESYCAIHNVDKDLNLGDVSKIKNDDIPKADIITYGFPCQDISIAGKQEGIKEGTRSGLLYEAERIIEYVKPKYAIAENVKNLVSKRHKEDFEQLLERLDSYGYNSYWKVLNAKDYGIPQNRERVFIVSIRKDIDNGSFKFPKKQTLDEVLLDFLDSEVGQKYYLTAKQHENFQINNDNLTDAHKKAVSDGIYKVVGTTLGTKAQGTNSRHWVYDVNHVISTIDATTYKQPKQILVGRANIKGYDQIKRVYNPKRLSPTLTTMKGGHREPKIISKLSQQYKIRKLTPLECWRLMGFDDEDYWKARRRLERVFYNGNDRSNSQMYKQAGNSIVVNVLEEIFKCLLCDY